MNDPFLTRDWADNHDRFTIGLGSALNAAWRTLKVSLDRLHRYEFDAPWQHQPVKRTRRPRGARLA